MLTGVLVLLAMEVLLGAASAAVQPQTARASTLDITLLHINDMHARYEETNKYSGSCSTSEHDKGQCYGGYARVATIVKEARASDHLNTIVLNAGDNFQGTVYYSVFKWNISAHFNNLIGFEATTLGNHEFDDRVEGLEPYVKALTTPLVIANADFSKEPRLAALNIPKSTVFERGGVKIGVVGYLTPETTFLSSPGAVTFSDEVTALQQETQRLKQQGVNILIGLGHSGYVIDQKIAAQVPDIDVVVGGHSHSFLYTGDKPDSEAPVGLYPTWITQPSGRRVPVVQAYAFTKYMGKLHLSFDANGELLSCEGKPVLLNKDVTPDPDTLADVLRWKEELGTRVMETVGRTEVLLDATKCRQVECNIGNLIADAAVFFRAEQYRGEGWTDAPIALVNSGSIRTSIDASHVGGNITLRDLMEVMPFDNLDVMLQVQGSVLRAALEHSVEEYVPGQAWKGAFLQLAGVHVTYDVGRPVGRRVVSAKVRCGNCSIPVYSALDDSKLYTIIVSSFLANGGDGYSMLTNITGTSLQETDASVVENYVRKQSPVYTGIEERIVFTSGTSTTAAPAPTTATGTSRQTAASTTTGTSRQTAASTAAGTTRRSPTTGGGSAPSPSAAAVSVLLAVSVLHRL